MVAFSRSQSELIQTDNPRELSPCLPSPGPDQMLSSYPGAYGRLG